MAFNRAKLCKIGGGQGGTPARWMYKTADTHANVDPAAYFATGGDVLKLGDIIDVVVVTNIDASNEAVSTYGSHIVNSRSLSAGVYTIDVTNVTAGSVIDSD